MIVIFSWVISLKYIIFYASGDSGILGYNESCNRARSLHRKWSCSSRTLGDDMLAARCLMLNSYLIDRYFSVRLTTNIGDASCRPMKFMEGTASEVGGLETTEYRFE